MKRLLTATSFFILHFWFSSIAAQQIISLDGPWDFFLDRDNTLEPPADAQYTDYVMLPGSMLTNEKGDPVSVRTQWTGSLYDSSYFFNPYMEKYRREVRSADDFGGQASDGVKFPFFLTPKYHYVGTAWYHRSVYVPKSLKDQRITLFLERPHIETTLFINGKEVGHQTSLSTPHSYDVTRYLRMGRKNDIAIRVYNGIENVCVGQDSHSVTDQTQGNWNGIVGRIELQAHWDKVNIERVTLRTNAAKRQVKVIVELGDHVPPVRVMPLNDYSINVSIEPLTARGRGYTERKEANWHKREFVINMAEDTQLWDEFSPHLYRLTVAAGDDVYETTFGLRDVSVDGRQLKVNGRPVFLRGTVENCCFPETGFPPMDENEWMRIFRKCKDYGLNHMRFHSYCPPEAAFAAADRVGMYLQPEGPSWPNHGVRLRRGMKIDKYLLEESKRIIDTYGHHPSFLMMAAGNEPAGDWVTYCNDWVKAMKKYDPTKIYCGASVGGGWAWDSGSEYHVKGGARGLDEWNRRAPSSDDDYYSGITYPRNYKAPQTASKGTTVVSPSGGEEGANNSPIIAHEQGQWCAFPDFKEIPQYTGVYQARNFEIFRDLLRDNGMEQMSEKFLMASGRLQTLCYKYEIERNLRTKDYAGFQLLGLNDYSGQGTALVGVLNVFWREKGYCTAKEWREFCNAIVPLARFPKFVYTTADTLVVPVEVYNAYKVSVSDVRPSYYISYDSTHVVTGGQLKSTFTLPVGKNYELGVVKVPLAKIQAPAKLTLTVNLSGVFKNHWDFWVYPSTSQDERAERKAEKAIEKGIYICDTLDAKAEKQLAKGGTVLLTAAGRVTLGSDVRQNYLPVFWNTSWFKMRPPHTTGAYIQKEHPLFKYGFPTDDWSNLNWWELLNRAQVMNLMELPLDYQSPIQPIDTWHVSRKLGMLIEARVGKGRLLMTTMDITNRLDSRPVARQMRKAILSYMQSADFQPSLQLTPEVIQHFYTRQAPPVNMFTKDSPDELKPKIN